MVNKQIIVEDFDDIKIPVVITWKPWSVALNVLISPKIVTSTTNGCSLVTYSWVVVSLLLNNFPKRLSINKSEKLS